MGSAEGTLRSPELPSVLQRSELGRKYRLGGPGQDGEYSKTNLLVFGDSKSVRGMCPEMCRIREPAPVGLGGDGLDSIIKQTYSCGAFEIAEAHFSGAEATAAEKEEVRLRLDGRIPFGQKVRRPGPFSGWFRYYARETPIGHGGLPHAVIMPKGFNAPKEMCLSNTRDEAAAECKGIPAAFTGLFKPAALSSRIEDRLVGRWLGALEGKAFSSGYNKGKEEGMWERKRELEERVASAWKEAYGKGYSKGWEDAKADKKPNQSRAEKDADPPHPPPMNPSYASGHHPQPSAPPSPETYEPHRR